MPVLKATPCSPRSSWPPGTHIGALPASIANALAVRAATLPAASQAVLRIAAVAGRSIAYDVLRSATRLPDAELADALRAAVHAKILEPEHAGERFAFRHAFSRRRSTRRRYPASAVACTPQ